MACVMCAAAAVIHVSAAALSLTALLAYRRGSSPALQEEVIGMYFCSFLLSVLVTVSSRYSTINMDQENKGRLWLV